MNTSTSSSSRIPGGDGPGGLALVLAGAGSAGNAWQLGLLAGLADGGIHLAGADLIVGTSAGSTVAAQMTSGTPPAELYASILTERHPRPDASAPRRGDPNTSTLNYLDWSNGIIAESDGPADMRRRLGASALAMDTSDGEHQARWREIVAARLSNHQWPQQRVLIAAVDAHTGEPVAFDRASGVPLVDAVAASTSNGFGAVPPYRIGDRRFINGGYRRNENADLATGYARVVVLAPFGGRSRTPAWWGMDLATQVDELRDGGSRVETVFPDAGAGDVFGVNAMDPSTRPGAARGGYAQGAGLVRSLAEFWRG